MARVREWVLAHTAGGGGGRVWQGGAELAASVKQLSAALNAQEIPSASNVIDAYNRDVQLQAPRAHARARRTAHTNSNAHNALEHTTHPLTPHTHSHRRHAASRHRPSTSSKRSSTR